MTSHATRASTSVRASRPSRPLGAVRSASRMPAPAVGRGAAADPERDLLDPGVDRRAQHLAGPDGRGARSGPAPRASAATARGLGQLDDRARGRRSTAASAPRPGGRVGRGRGRLPLPAAGGLHGHERALAAIGERRRAGSCHAGRARRQPIGQRPRHRDRGQRPLERVGRDQDGASPALPLTGGPSRRTSPPTAPVRVQRVVRDDTDLVPAQRAVEGVRRASR